MPTERCHYCHDTQFDLHVVTSAVTGDTWTVCVNGADCYDRSSRARGARKARVWLTEHYDRASGQRAEQLADIDSAAFVVTEHAGQAATTWDDDWDTATLTAAVARLS